MAPRVVLDFVRFVMSHLCSEAYSLSEVSVSRGQEQAYPFACSSSDLLPQSLSSDQYSNSCDYEPFEPSSYVSIGS